MTLRRTILQLLTSTLLLPLTAVASSGQEARIPAPAITLYPGDIISDAVLIDTIMPSLPPGAALTERAKIVGRVARRTLLAGKPIPVGALDEPRLVANGATVRILFDEPGLAIATAGQALQPGLRGDLIRVRNIESGVVVTGTVQPDGSVKVGG